MKGPPRASDGTAKAAFSCGEGLFQMDVLPDEAASGEAAGWSGTYDLEENIFGLTGIGLEISADGVPVSVTQIYESHSEAYALGAPTEYAVTTTDERDTAVRAGWNARGQLEILFMYVGEAWWTRMAIIADEGVATIRMQASHEHDVWLRGVRAAD